MAALLDRALEFALTKGGRDSQFMLKPEQKEIIEVLVLFKEDVLGVLPSKPPKSKNNQHTSNTVEKQIVRSRETYIPRNH